ncbi:MAG TPA: hypothetical protein VI408_04250 [Gaiellaceae bacterium]
MGRLAAMIAATGIAAMAFAVTGQATPPTHEPAPSGPVDFPAGVVCSFPVHGDVVVNNQKITTFSDGSQLVTGAFVSQLTNVWTGKTITINAPGPLRFAFSGDTLTVTGRGQNVYFFFPGDLGPNAPGALLLMDGLVTEVFDSTGLVSFSHSGSVTDLCAVLAS